MIAVTIVNIIAVLLTYLQRNNQIRYGFGIAIFLLICFYGIRYDYGNDYMAYFNNFQIINGQSTLELSTDSKNLEWGWVVLNRIFKPIGFFGLVFFLTIVQFYSFYRVVSKYVPRNQQYIALFFYIFTPGLLITMLSMMRQTLAMNIILLSIPFILNKKIIKSLFIIILAAQFHQSAYIMLILPFTLYLQKISNIKYHMIFISLYLLIIILHSTIAPYIRDFTLYYFERYETYTEAENAKLGTGIGFVFTCIFGLMIILIDNKTTKNSWFLKLLTISYIILPLGISIPLITRIGYYFNLAGVLGTYLIAEKAKNNIVIKTVFTLMICITVYTYVTFFYSPIWTDKIKQFHTIFNYI